MSQEVTPQFAIEYLLDDCEDCPENKDGECVTESHCFEVKQMCIKALRREQMTDEEKVKNLLTELIDMIDNGSQKDLDRADEIAKYIVEAFDKLISELKGSE